MKKPSIAIISIVTILLWGSVRLPVSAVPPRHPMGLDIYTCDLPDDAWRALKLGDVDLIQWPLTYEQYQDAVSDPTLVLVRYGEYDMFQFALNNNYTTPDFPGVRSPTNEITFRRALAHMLDKDWIVSEVLMGFGERIDAPFAAPSMGYANESVIGKNYPYPFNLTRATELLEMVFADTNGDGIRNYPVGWPGRESGPNLDPVKFGIRGDHTHRLKAGRALAANMQALGIPVNKIELGGDYLRPMIEEEWSYHIYTDGWSLGRYPTYLHGLFNSINCIPGGSNYVTLFNESGLPNYPDIDEATNEVYYAKTIENFVDACKKASELLVEYCVTIPLWSYASWWAYRKNLVGIVNMDGSGLENTYTFLNAYKVDDPATPEDESQYPIWMGTVHAPKQLNILYSSWYIDYAVLDRIFDSLLAVEPYNLAEHNPWIAQDWDASTWYDSHDDETKTKVTYWIRKDVWWHAPVTGEAVRQFTAHDVEFTIWYIYAFDDCWHWSRFMDVHHTKVLDNFTIEVYFDSQSIWHVYNPTGPLLPKYEYLDMLCKEECAVIEIMEPVEPSTEMIFTENQVIQIINCTKYPEGTPLVEGVDFEILAAGAPEYGHNMIHWLRPLAPNETVVMCYWTPDLDPHGYYLAGLDWEKTFYSLGPYYVIEICAGMTHWAIFDSNPSHFLGAPPLGEIDWKWTWQGTTKPCSGYFQVNLYDAVRLLKAYGSSGYAVPDANWFPGADLTPTDIGYVGLYDAVTLLSKYGTKWGTPPP